MAGAGKLSGYSGGSWRIHPAVDSLSGRKATSAEKITEGI
jgi:hypothetical protein